MGCDSEIDAWRIAVAREIGETSWRFGTDDQYPDIVDSLYVQATDPQNTRSVQASKLLLEVMWRSVDEASTASDLSLMSVKELKQLAAGLYDELDDREHDGETAAGS